MIILGGGFTGLLAGCIFKDAIIYEEKTEEECQMKHQAVLRMKSDKIAEYLGIKFKKVQVNKSIWYDGKNVLPTPDMVHMYSKKVSGTISNRSISNIDTEIRYIPPENFYNILLRKSCDIRFEHTEFDINKRDSDLDCAINTNSLVTLGRSIKDFSMARHGSLNFDHKPIYVNKFKIKNCDSHATIYYPHEDQSVYRATLNGDVLIIESTHPLHKNNDDFLIVSNSLGLKLYDVDEKLLINHKQKIGKMNPISSQIRSKLIFDLTMKHNIYSLGRVATWRPKVMLDDAFDDIFVIRRLIEDGGYASVLYQQDQEK